MSTEPQELDKTVQAQFDPQPADARLSDPSMRQLGMTQMLSPMIADDFDADGQIDVVFASPGRMAGFYSAGDVANSSPIALPPLVTAMTSLDIDGDGSVELLAASNLTGQSTALTWSDGESELVEFPIENFDSDIGPLVLVTSLSAPDLDADGIPEIVATFWQEFSPHIGSSSGMRIYSSSDGRRWSEATERWLGDIAIDTSVFAALPIELDGDDRPDMLVVSDFGDSMILTGSSTGFLVAGGSDSLTDENGMGTLLHDFDADGELEWFVTSVTANAGDCRRLIDGLSCTGNRLYEISSDGETVQDTAQEFCLDDGGWGWGASMFTSTEERPSMLTTAGMFLPSEGESELAYLDRLLKAATTEETSGELGGVYRWDADEQTSCWQRTTLSVSGSASFRSAAYLFDPATFTSSVLLGQTYGGLTTVQSPVSADVILTSKSPYLVMRANSQSFIDGFPCEGNVRMVTGGAVFSATTPVVVEVMLNSPDECEQSLIDAWADEKGWVANWRS